MNVLDRLNISRRPGGDLEGFEIRLQGGRVASTTYWQTLGARNGMTYLQWSPRGAHLLVPRSCMTHTLDMLICRQVVVSVGRMAEFENCGDVYEVMFDDGSDAPFAIHLVADDSSSKDSLDTDQWEPEHGSTRCIEIVAEVGVASFVKVCHFREVASLPSRAPWPIGV